MASCWSSMSDCAFLDLDLWPPSNRCPNVGRPIEEGEAQATAVKITLIPYLASPYSLKKSRGSTLDEFLFEPMLVNSTPEPASWRDSNLLYAYIDYSHDAACESTRINITFCLQEIFQAGSRPGTELRLRTSSCHNCELSGR